MNGHGQWITVLECMGVWILGTYPFSFFPFFFSCPLLPSHTLPGCLKSLLLIFSSSSCWCLSQFGVLSLFYLLFFSHTTQSIDTILIIRALRLFVLPSFHNRTPVASRLGLLASLLNPGSTISTRISMSGTAPFSRKKPATIHLFSLLRFLSLFVLFPLRQKEIAVFAS